MILCMVVALSAATIIARTKNSMTVRNGGTGPYIEPDLYASIYLRWMDWQLKGAEADWENITGWSVKTKNF